jgi:hypothetical protein
MFVGLMLTNVFWFAMNIEPVFGPAPYLTLKWTRVLGSTGKTDVGALAADLNNDGKMEIVVAGAADSSGSSGTVRALNGSTGVVLWTYTGVGITPHTPVEIADLDKDGFLEIVVPKINSPMALRGNTGSVYWERTDVVCGNLYSAVYDVDGDGYPEVFVNRHKGYENSYDYDTMLSYDGTVLRQAWAWHSCWGGFTIGDANFDGRFELYQGDRSSAYSGEGDTYTTGGMGVRAFDALTLTPLWNNPDILCSSQCPILADVDKDGILDVVIFAQTNTGPVVLNSADGSVLTTGGKYRKGASGMSSHSQATVYDIDGDGNLEMISCDNSNPKIWDLYDWKLDATLPIVCTEPPKVGNVTGGNMMDIIAMPTDGNNIYVYSYNSVTKNYDEVDHVTGVHGADAFTLVQDVDGDGYNELVVTSLSGEVYCFDTRAPAPNPRVRSTTPFYSEYRRGAAEYVPSPSESVVRPALSDEQPANGALNQAFNPTLSVTVSDFQGHRMDIVFKTNVTGTWVGIPGGTYINVLNGVYSATPTTMGSYGTTYYWSVNATDTVTKKWSYNVYSFTTSSRSPTQNNPLLELSSGTGNLICSSQATPDPDGDEVTNIYNWKVNGDSLTNLQMSFDTRTDSGTRTVLTDGFEVGFGNWDGNGVTDWARVSSQKHSGTFSAYADLNDNYLTSDNLDTSTADSITVSFWYRDVGIDADDNVYLQFYDGSTYRNIFEVGTNGAEGEWHQYSVWYRTLFQYQIPNFRIRFDARSIDSGEELWIDDVSITIGGAPAKDYSDESNDGGVHGATWTSDGVVGGAYVFDGNDYIRVTENGNSLGGDGSWSEMSVEFWVKATSDAGTQTLLMKHDRYNYSMSEYGMGYMVEFRGRSTTNVVTWYTYTPSRSYVTYNIPKDPSSWHHVVCTYKSGPGLVLYVDGVQVRSLAASGNINATQNGPLNIGHEGGEFFVGMLDEVRIYPRALSPSQVAQRYAETRNGLSMSSTIAKVETEIGEVWSCEVTPNDSFGDGTSRLSNTVIIPSIGNPPVASNLVITPLSPTTSQNLLGSYTWSDPDLGDYEWDTEIRWYKNSALQPSLNDALTVPASFTAKNENWYFTVKPSDGVNFGIPRTSATVTIVDSPPTFAGVHITPDPAFDTSTLTAYAYGWFDADNDAPSYTYQWQVFEGGKWVNIPGQTSSTLGSSHSDSGDCVKVLCTATPGGATRENTRWIATFTSTSLTNPLLVSSSGSGASATTIEDLICYNHYSATATTNIYRWDINGVYFNNLLMPFNTNNPSTASDYSGYSNNGIITGATWTSNGIEGGAYSFSGDDVITVADSSSLGNDGTWSEITVEYWVNPAVDQMAARILSKNGGGAGDSGNYMTGFNTNAPSPYNTVFFGVTIGTSFRETYSDTDTVIPTGSWSHIVGTYKSGEGVKLYINGVLKSSSIVYTGNIAASVGEPLLIGYSSPVGGEATRYFNGGLDEIRIYNRALSPKQALQRYVESKDNLISSSTIVGEETEEGENWRCLVTPNTSIGDQTAKYSNYLTVGSPVPQYDLTIGVSGSGTTDPAVGTDSYPEGSSVQVTATPAGGWSLSKWVLDSVDLAPTNPFTVTMNAAHTLTAVFVEVPQYDLTIGVSGSGTTDPAPGTYPYSEGSIVQVQAIADSGYQLSHWLLDSDNVGSANPYSVSMNADHALTAVFVVPPYLFADGFESGFATWSGVSGSPTVVSSPVHHGSYAALFNAQTAYRYAYTTLSPSQATVYHRFYVQVNELPNAEGEIYDLARGYAAGTAIYQVGIYYSGGSLYWRFNYRNGATWTGVNSAATTIGTNTWYCIELYWKLGATNGEVHLYVNGVEVAGVTGRDTDNYGGCDTIRNGCSSKTGTFTGLNIYEDCIAVAQTYIGPEGETPPIQYQLTIEVSGSGTTSPVPETYTYPAGTVVPVTAIPDSGYALSYWLRNGSNVGADNPYSITMNANYNLTAVFVEVPPFVFADGFESGNFASWSGTAGSPTVVNSPVSSPVYCGNYALQCDASNEFVYKTISGYSTVYARFYVRMNALPGNGGSVKVAIGRDTVGNALWELYFERSSTGTLRIKLRSSVPSVSSQLYNYVYAVDTWYCFEVEYSQSAAGEYRVWLNGDPILSRTGVDTSSRQFGRLDVGILWSSYAVTFTTYVDCVVIDQSYVGPEP